MEVREGYKQTEVGVIPEDWDLKKLSESTTLMTNGFVGTATSHYTEFDDGVIYIQGFNVEENAFNFTGIKRVTQAFHKRHSKSCLQEGDLLTVQTGDVGLTTIIPKSLIGSNCHALIITRVRKQKIDPHFISYYLNSHQGRSRLKEIETGTTMKHINVGDMVHFDVPLPPTKAEQTFIATALSDADALIQSLEKLIAKKRLIKQGSMQELLKPKEGWVVKKLGEVGDIDPENLSSGTNPTYSFKYISLEDVNQGTLRSYTEQVFSTAPSRARRIIRKGDVLVSTVRPNLQSHLLINYDIKDTICSTGFSVVRCKYNVADPAFIFAHLFANYIERQIESLITGSSYPAINSSDMRALNIPCPDITEQTRIATILSDMDVEIFALETKLTKYKQIKQGMMQELLTGRIRLVENASAKQKVVSIDKKLSKKKHNWQINEAVVIAVLTKEFGSDKFPLGRKRYTKLSYLLHRYVERETEGYLKKVAGPYNPSTRYGGPERIAQENKYIKQSRLGQYSGFVTSDNIAQAEEYFHKWYGQDALKWLNQFKYEKNDTLELWGTVDMAVQDLKRTGKAVSTEAVKSLINNTEEWKPKLKRSIFSDENIAMAILKTEELFNR